MESSKHARGAIVSVGGQLGRFIIKLIGLAVLSRILTAGEIGQVAMILAIVGIASILSDFGLSLAAIQANELSKSQANSLFWVNAGIGLSFTIGAFLAAPWIAELYGLPELEELTKLLAPIFVINSCSVQFRVQLNRELKYGTLALVDVVAPLLGVGAAVLSAHSGLGAVSLVIQEVTAALTLFFVYLSTSTWRPSGWVHLRDIRPFMSFSVATTATQASNYASTNLPTAMIGAVLGSVSVGQYSRAYQIFMLPIQQLAAPLTRVALPMLARSTTAEFGARFNRIQLLLGYALSTPLTLFSIWAFPIVHLGLGPGWEEAAGVLEVLCIGGCFQAAGYAYYWAFLARSKVKILFFAELFGRCVLIFLVMCTVNNGSKAVATAFSAGLAAVWLTTAIVSMKHLPVNTKDTTLIFIRSVGIGILALIVARSFVIIADLDRSVQASLIATGVYLTVALATLVVPAVRQDMRTIIGTLHLLVGKRVKTLPEKR